MIMSITSDGQMVLVYEEEMFGEEKEAHKCNRTATSCEGFL